VLIGVVLSICAVAALVLALALWGLYRRRQLERALQRGSVIEESGANEAPPPMASGNGYGHGIYSQRYSAAQYAPKAAGGMVGGSGGHLVWGGPPAGAGAAVYQGAGVWGPQQGGIWAAGSAYGGPDSDTPSVYADSSYFAAGSTAGSDHGGEPR
jgi:hypothetical protein